MTKQRVKTQAPTSTWRFWKFWNQSITKNIQQKATNYNTWSKGVLTNSEATVKYKYSHIWTKSQSFSRLNPPTVEWLWFSRYGSLSASYGQEKLALSRLILVRPDCKNWLVRVNPCQFELQKMACPNEVLPDYFMKFRLWEWNFANLFCENQIMKVEFCQFKLWMLYHTSVVLSGKLFRTKMCFWLKPISVNLLCNSKISQLVYSLRRWRF